MSKIFIVEDCTKCPNFIPCTSPKDFRNLGTRGICVMNYGLYPSEWFNPQAESEDKE